MKLSIRNLGRIESADIDIKPLTVFVGPNNTNKTWTAYAIFGLAKGLSYLSPFGSPHTKPLLKSPSTLRKRIDTIAERVQATLLSDRTVISKCEVKRTEIVSDEAWPIEIDFTTAQLGKVLAIPDRELSPATASLSIDRKDATTGRLDICEFTFAGPDRRLSCSFLASDRSRLGPPEQTTLQIDDELPSRVTRIVADTLEQCALGFLSFIVALPAERKALVAFPSADWPFRPAFAGRTSAEFPNAASADLPEPINDFVSLVRLLPNLGRIPGRLKSELGTLAEILESNVLQRELKFQEERRAEKHGGGEGRWRYSIDSKFDLDMHATSSLVRSLAGLDFYLQNFCFPNSVLVIDEPEMNAHPDAQLKIIELLATVAQRGTKVIITTHSPYIVDHLGNLMQASRLDKRARDDVAKCFKLGSAEAFLSPDDVAVYLFSGEPRVTVSDILDRDSATINLDNFSDPTSYMANLINQLDRAASHTTGGS